jgi:hypothetical protein
MTALKVRALKARCESLAVDLLDTGAASAEAIADVRPGGAENPARDGNAWLTCYGQLQLLRGRAQGSHGRSSGVADVSGDDALALAALAAKPAIVRAAVVDYLVHPKSLDTLLHCHARDLLLGRLATLTADVLDRDTRRLYADRTHEAIQELAYQTRVLCWIACTGGPGLPFEEHEREPVLPQGMRDLDPITVLEINRTFARVNWVNLKALESLIAPDPDAGGDRKRPSWSMFLGTLALELHEDPLDLIRNRSLASVLASTQLAAASHREAMDEAKRKSERERQA